MGDYSQNNGTITDAFLKFIGENLGLSGLKYIASN